PGMVTGSLSLVAGVLPEFVAQRAFRRLGLTRPEARKLMFGPTAGSRFWDRPSVVRLLSSPDKLAARSGPVPDSAPMLAREARELAAGIGVGPLSSAASSAAQALAEEIRRLDDEVLDLASQ